MFILHRYRKVQLAHELVHDGLRWRRLVPAVIAVCIWIHQKISPRCCGWLWHDRRSLGCGYRYRRMLVQETHEAAGLLGHLGELHELLLEVMRDTLERVPEEPRGLLALGKVAALDPPTVLLHVKQRWLAHVKVNIREHVAANILDAGNGVDRYFHFKEAVVVSNLPCKRASFGLVRTNEVIRPQLETVPAADGEGRGTELYRGVVDGCCVGGNRGIGGVFFFLACGRRHDQAGGVDGGGNGHGAVFCRYTIKRCEKAKSVTRQKDLPDEHQRSGMPVAAAAAAAATMASL